MSESLEYGNCGALDTTDVRKYYMFQCNGGPYIFQDDMQLSTTPPIFIKVGEEVLLHYVPITY